MFGVKQVCCQPKVIEVGHNYSDDDDDHDTVWDMLADSVALKLLDTTVWFSGGSYNTIIECFNQMIKYLIRVNT